MIDEIKNQIPEEYKNCVLIESNIISTLFEERGLVPVATLIGPSIVYLYDREGLITNLRNKKYERQEL